MTFDVTAQLLSDILIENIMHTFFLVLTCHMEKLVFYSDLKNSYKNICYLLAHKTGITIKKT